MASSSSNSTNLMQGLDSKSRNLIGKIVGHLKSQGDFDELRKDCLEELDKMESFRQLNQRVESYVATFLSKQEWSDSLSKNQMRNSLRKHVCESETLKTGAQRLVTQVIEKRSRTFQTRLEGIVQDFIYRDQERVKQERRSRYQSRNSHQQEASKTDQEKQTISEKPSQITDVNDIISQIELSEAEKVKPSGSSVKLETAAQSQKQNKIDVGLKTGTSKKPENVASPSDITKSSAALSKANVNRRLISKRLASKAPPASPSDKAIEVTQRTKVNSSTQGESQLKIVEEAASSTYKTDQRTEYKADVVMETEVAMETNLISNESVGTKTETTYSESDISLSSTKGDNERQTGESCEVKAQQATELDAKNIEKGKSNIDMSDNNASIVDCTEKEKKADNFSSDESEIDDSISDISSVHTSDLSSFDGELSLSESSDDEHKSEKKDTLKKEKADPPISSTRKKAKDNQVIEKKRGRPRKEANKTKDVIDDQLTTRHSRLKSRDGRSKRQIKKKRCYSPSSEDTREICLPSKRSRANSRE